MRIHKGLLGIRPNPRRGAEILGIRNRGLRFSCVERILIADVLRAKWNPVSHSAFLKIMLLRVDFLTQITKIPCLYLKTDLFTRQ